MMELVIYALLAAFIFLRLYNSLGKSTGRSINLSFSKLVDNLERNKVETNVDHYIDHADKNMAPYKEILKKNKDFAIADFMQGASMAFEMIIKYFNQGNLTQLKQLLDRNLYNSFVEKVTNRQTINESIIVSIITQKITEIKVVKNIAFISVYFLSEQINFSKNDQGEIIKGDTHTINQVKDTWQFKKNINSSDPIWLLVSIKNDA
ncbi:hypothetical protein BIY23_02605 [Wolbachia pipientis]|uniref:Tim44-like domain-containing protein n=1 Tax=Wolbachia pipientis TaxID=955 RepID=A0A1E7QKI0_WOLPI|nr:Tim44/TimA family putative adaptor protein [Wolbachia pipientis]OEY86724.1 hypothetical protein BIY23_02605 [Wolbachia pipientis]